MRRYYTTPVPERSADTETETATQRLEEAGLLTQDGASVERVASEAADVHLTGTWRYGSPIDDKLAAEVESLSNSSFGSVPYFSPNRELDAQGYYEVQRAEVNPVHASFQAIWQYDIRLSKVGTKERHWRAIETNPEDVTESNPFADNTDPLLGIHAAARKTRWWTRGNDVEPATRVDTVETEYGPVARYDPEDSSLQNPTLLFELDFDLEGPVDVVVWDDRALPKLLEEEDPESGYGDSYGENYGSPTTSVTQWKHVFNTDWNRIGTFVVDNGRLRLTFDEENGEVIAEEWTPGPWVNDINDSWDEIPIDHSDHVLYDASLESVRPEEVELFVQFEDTDSGELDAVRFILSRGMDRVLILESESEIPSSLENMLDPIASDTEPDLQLMQTLIPRVEVG